MFFKKSRGVFIWFVIGLGFFSGCGFRGCGLQLNEAPPTSDVIDLGEGCLRGSSDILNRYFDGIASEQEVNRLFRCASKSLQLFAQRTRGVEEGKFSSQELQRFLEKNFLNGERISNGLMSDAMALKQTFLGGRPETITIAEIEKIHSILEVLREQAIRLLPYQPLTSQNVLTFEPAFFDQAMKAVVDAGKAIGSAIQEKGVIYTFLQLEQFLFEIERLYPDPENPTYLRNQISFLKTLKTTVLGEPEDRFVEDDLSRLFQVVAGWYSVRFQIAYFTEKYFQNPEYANGGWLTGKAHTLLTQMARPIISLLEDSVVHHTGQNISFEELDHLIDESYPKEEINFLPIKKSTLKQFLRPLLNYILGPQITEGSPRTAGRGLDLITVRRLKKIVEDWDSGQFWLETVFERLAERQKSLSLWGLQEGGKSIRFLRDEVRQEMETLLKGQSLPQLEGIPSKVVLAELYLFSKQWPLFLNEESPLEISFFGKKAREEYSLSTLSLMNFLMRVIQMPMKGYGNHYLQFKLQNGLRLGSQALPSDEGLLVEELHRIEEDLRSLLIELRLLHPERVGLYQSRFREGNLFTFSSFGDQWLMAEEGAQLLAFMISAKKLSARVHEQIAKKCMEEGAVVMDPQKPTQPLEDFFGGIQMKKNCYWNHFYQNFSIFNSTMPGMVSHFQGLDLEGLRAFKTSLEALMESSATSPPDIVDSGDTEAVVGVLQYIEAIFDRHDLDRSSTLDQEEAKRAFPVFRYTIAQLGASAGLSSEEDILCLYLYLLIYGEPPSGLGFITGTWKKDPFNGSIQNMKFSKGRNRMLKIFQQMSTG